MQPINKRKEIVYKTNERTRIWVTLLSRLINLTNREIDVLVVMIDKRRELVSSGIKQPYLSQLLFSTEGRKSYCTSLEITDFNFTNLLGSLRKKGVFVKTEDGGEDINDRLIPTEEMIIKFVEE